MKMVRSLSGKSVVYFLVTVLGVGFSMALNLILAKKMISEDYGYYSFIISFYTLIAIPCQLGLPTLIIKKIPTYLEKQNGALHKGLIYFSLLITLILSTCVMYLVWFYAEIISELLHLERGILGYTILLVLLISLIAILAAILRASNSPIISIFPVVVLRPVLLISFILIFAGGVEGVLNVESFLIVYILTTSIVCFLLLSLVLFKNRNLSNVSSKINGKIWFFESFPMLLLSSVAILSDNLPVLILNALIDLSSVAQFRISMLGGSVLSFLILSFTIVHMPIISALFNKKEFNEIQKISQKCAKLSFYFSIPICLFYLCFSEILVAYFLSDEYKDVHIALKVFAVSRLFMTLLGIPGGVLTMSGRASYVGGTWLSCLSVSILLGAFMSMYFGFIGMVIGILLGEWALNIVLHRKLRNILGISSSIKLFKC